MIKQFEIQGDASEYEAAVLTAVLDQIRRRRNETRARRPKVSRHLSAWMRAGRLTAADPMPRPDPGLNGDGAPTRPTEVPWLRSGSPQSTVHPDQAPVTSHSP